MQRKDAGFTLVEAIMAMSVLAMLAAVAAPPLVGLVERQRTAAATNSLTTHMALARMAAIVHRRPTILCPSTTGTACDPGSDWSNGWMLFIDTNHNRRPDAGDEILRVDLDPTSRTLRAPGTSGRPYLRYLPDGRSAGTNPTVSVCNLKGALLARVVVNNMGRARTERPKTPAQCPR